MWLSPSNHQQPRQVSGKAEGGVDQKTDKRFRLWAKQDNEDNEDNEEEGWD